MRSQSQTKIGIIGGSGLYQLEGLSHIKQEPVLTPFGSPSDSYITGKLDGVDLVFLPRHGRDHSLLPSELNYQANIFGFKRLGVTHLISVTAVGSLKEEIPPLDIVIPDQLVDRTVNRKSTFFGDGIVAHVPFSDPFCPDLSALLFDCAGACKARVHKGGTLVTIEGPAFSTRAESKLYQSWGIDIIGMTAMQEAKLAREAEICYAALAMVTDYDCWREETESVTVSTVLDNLSKNTALAGKILNRSVSAVSGSRTCLCSESLKNAIMTPPDRIDDQTKEDLAPLIRKYMPN